ncbi:hypothetical protein KEM56_000462, partial [Ascosphaera pollenicola]
MADLAQRPDIVDDEEIQQCHQVPKLPDSPPPMNQQRSPTYLKPLAYKSMNSVGFIIPLLIDIILVLAAGLFISPTDLWGNVKIPRLEALKNMFVTPDKDGWYDVKDLPKKVESWSSLFGIPVIDLEDYNDQKISFFIESTYLSLSCGTVTSMGHNFETRYLTVDCPDCQSNTSPANHEWRPHPDTGLLNSRQDMFRGPPFPGLNALQAKNKSVTAARTIQFQSTELDNGSKYSCSVTQQPVEVVIKCSYGRCGATKIREWKSNPFRGENYTALDLWAKDALWLISDSSQNSLNSSEVLGAAQLFLNDSNAMPLQPMGVEAIHLALGPSA